MIQTLEDLLESVNTPPWDLILIGDGSGVGWDKSSGWAVCMIDRLGGYRKFFHGFVSAGTVNWAEAVCFTHPLRYDFFQVNKGKLKSERKVLIFSDSQVTVHTGNGLYPKDANGDVWAQIEFFRSKGYKLTYHFTNRSTFALHTLVDQISKANAWEIDDEWMNEQAYLTLPSRSTLQKGPDSPSASQDSSGTKPT